MSLHDPNESDTGRLPVLAHARQLAEVVPLVLWTADPDGVVDYASKAWTDTVGRADGRDTVIPQNWLEAVHPDDAAAALAGWQASLASGAPLAMEMRVRHQQDGSYRWQSVRAHPIRIEGVIVKWCGVVTDVHDRKTNQDKLQALNARLSATLESIADALFTFDHDWRFTYVNPEGERVLQMSRDQLLGQQLWQTFPLFVGTGFEAACHRALAERCTLSVEELYGPLGMWLEIRIYPGEEGLAIYFRDISDRKQAERQAREAAYIQARIVAAQREISSAGLGLQAVLDLMAARAQSITGAAGAVVALIEDDEIVYHAGTGIARNHIGLRIKCSHSLAGAASLQQAVLTCVDTELDARLDQNVCRQMGGRSTIVVPLRSANRISGVVQVIYDKPHAFDTRAINNFQILVESLGAVIERHRITEQLQVSEQQYRLLFERNPHPIWVYEAETLRILAVNSAAIRHYGYSEQKFLRMNLRDLRPPEDWPRFEREVLSGPADETTERSHQWRHLKADGSLIDVEVAAYRIVFNGKAACIAQISDITQRLRAERELQRINRSQRMLNACNEVLVRAQDEATLLADICRLAVEVGGYRMSWIGFAQDDEVRSVIRGAHHGEVSGYLDEIAVSWSAATASGCGPVGRAIRGNAVVVVEDIDSDPDFAPWARAAQKRGYHSVVSLPLADLGRSFGCLSLYCGEQTQFGNDELHLLQSLATDLTYGLAKLRAQAEQRRMHDTILKVAAGVSGASGDTFFEQLARNMAEALGADAAVIAQLEPGQSAQARTIAAVLGGSCVANFSYPLAATPCPLRQQCERQRQCSECLLSADFSAAPLGEPFAALAPQFYAGRRLLGSGGQMLGVIFVLFREPPGQSELVASALQIFGARAASELERKDADVRIREQASLLDKAQDAIVVRSIDDRILFWNKGAERLYGWTSAEILGRQMSELISNEPAASARATEKVLRNGEWSGELTQVRKDGSRFSIEGHWTLIDNEDGLSKSIFEINTDITERKLAEEKILQLAFYDPLTRLPNRVLLLDRLHEALVASGRSGQTGALLFIDLDNFKALNDTLGHDVGDNLLRKVTHRLVTCVRETDTVARLGGDEFVVLLENLGSNASEAALVAKDVGEKIIAALNEGYQLGDFLHNSTASLGITLFSDNQDSVGELLKRADLAMYQAKGAGRNTLRFFDPAMQQLVSVRVELEADLRAALVQQEFVLHYQPQVDSDGRVFGAEALIRWNHPQRGLVSPFDFISVAEETGLILPMGYWVMQTACAQLVRWAGQPATRELVLAVNVSARQFRQPDFVDQVLAVLAASGADPTRLKIELTESLLVDDLDETIEKMCALKECGVGFSLDDFGTGYSSLAYLKRLPLDQLKIDQSFVRDVLHDPNDAAIARTIVALAQSLGLTVIAEGVESEAQRSFLAENGCRTYQGYLFSRPLSDAQFEQYLAGPA